MIENAIFQRLSGFSALTALIGGTSPRITPELMTQDTAYPAITYQFVSGQRETAMGVDPGVVSTRLVVDSWVDTYAAARDVKEQVRACLQRFRGTLDSTVILDIFIEDDRDEPAELVNGVLVRRRSTEFTVWYRE